MNCQVCNAEGAIKRKRTGRVLCNDCQRAANGYQPMSRWSVDTGNIYYPGKHTKTPKPPKEEQHG